jgi:hypothetical protein
MAVEQQNTGTQEYGFDPLSDPQEARILYATLDSFRYDHKPTHGD